MCVMDWKLSGKRAFVTAGAHGIGEAIANVLASQGVSVIVADCDGEALGNRWAGTVTADLTTAAGVNRALEFLGEPPDILINNLGAGNSGSFADLDDERWQRSFDMNLMGCVRVCRALLPRMPEGSSVVNIGSDLAKQPEPSLMDYGACKAGLLYLTKALAKQYAPRIRVNAVLPGPVWTRMWTRPGGIVDQLVAHYGVDREAAVERFLQDRQLPLGIGQPEDVAHAVVFLASPLAKFITGASLDIGGTLRGLV
jgi:NAD(P)-dependent dehydrogenase (short-subunit alcohol dehydrogenase family)